MYTPCFFSTIKWIPTGLFCFLLLSCSSKPESTPEQAIKEVLTLIELAAEKRSLTDFMQHISDDYQDHQGQLKNDIRRLVQFQYIRNQKIHILSDIKSLEIDGDLATVELNAAMAARAADLEKSFLDVRANTHSFSILLRAEDGQKEWKVTGVSWQRGWR